MLNVESRNSNDLTINNGNKCIMNETFDNSLTKFGKPILSINFGKSLRLLSFQDILLLLEICQNKNVELPNIDKIVDFKNAIEVSQAMRQDCRLLNYSRNVHGRPLLMQFADLRLHSHIHTPMMIRYAFFLGCTCEK